MSQLTEYKPTNASALMLQSDSIDKIIRIAEIMASGKSTIPQHLRGSTGDCMAVVMQAVQWSMNPFSVAQKTHLVNGVLGYEAQLVAAVINSSGVVSDRFHFEWFGDWTKIVGKFKEVESKTKTGDDGKPKRYIVPAWEQRDEQGLGVRVWATIKGEAEPRKLELLMTQARTRNSTLWTEDPKQQIAYLAQKRWARLYAPDVILGVYTNDELEVLPPAPGQLRDLPPADVVQPQPKARQALPNYTDEQLESNLPAWSAIVESGRKSASDLLAMLSTKATFTEAQKARILSLKVTPPEPEKAPQQDEFLAAYDAAEKAQQQ